ncbi:hypothetical protein MMC28_002598 [Mycoblastus sanguinarius]|nr:hypothetical protein [Mycoblastus sanguinarius]
MTPAPPFQGDDDMVPLQISYAERAEDDDSEASSSESSTLPSQKPSLPRSRAKKARKSAQQSQNQTSKPLLRPARDILSRIRHDSALEESDFIVGYQDRHVPDAMEMEVSSWKGGGDVTDEEWIPEHRILYFRKKGDDAGQRVWDRAKRLDRLFGSGIVEETVERGGIEKSHDPMNTTNQHEDGSVTGNATVRSDESDPRTSKVDG